MFSTAVITRVHAIAGLRHLPLLKAPVACRGPSHCHVDPLAPAWLLTARLAVAYSKCTSFSFACCFPDSVWLQANTFSGVKQSRLFFYLRGDISCTFAEPPTDCRTCLQPLHQCHCHQLLIESSKCLRDVPPRDQTATNRDSVAALANAGSGRAVSDRWETGAGYWYELCHGKLMHQYNNILMSAVSWPFNICPQRDVYADQPWL